MIPLPDGQGSFVDRFREVAAAIPAATAIACDGRAISFTEVDRRSNQIGNLLLDVLDGPPARPVAMVLGHDELSLISMLGILKAGRPFVVLDPSSPPARMARIAGLAGLNGCVTDSVHAQVADRLAGSLGPVIDVAAAPADHSVIAPRAPDGEVACVLFTSGSTGQPKGVAWTHGTILSDVRAGLERFRFGPGDRVAAILPLSYAAGVTVAAWGLASGAALHLFDPRARGIQDLVKWLVDERTTTLHATPSLLRSMARAFDGSEKVEALRLITSTGEALQVLDVSALRPHVPKAGEFVNWFGASEAGVISFFPISCTGELVGARVPAGWPVKGKEVTILADDGLEVPTGEVGRLMITSRYLAAGYWGDDEATRLGFEPMPDGRTRYRSADLARIGTAGRLELLGRADHAVKIHGHLVQPAEVESALRRVEGVREAAVVGHSTPDSDPRLVAYVVPAQVGTISATNLRRALRDELPNWMLPATVVQLSQLPRNERGKVDTAALPSPHVLQRLRLDPPRNDLEGALAGIWARALDLDQVGIHDEFLDLGGDSLAARELLSELADALPGVDLPSSILVESPTVAELAARIDQLRGRSGSPHPTLVPLQTTGTRPPLFSVPAGGSLALTFLSLARHLGTNQPVYGLQAKALEQRGIPDWSVKRTAARHIRAMRSVQRAGPYAILGHSFGGLVAYEIAQQLSRAGDVVALLGMIDTYLPPVGPPEARDARAVNSSRWRRLLPRGRVDRQTFSWQTLRLAPRLPLTGLLSSHSRTHYELFAVQGMIVAQWYRVRPWPGRTVIYAAQDRPAQADAHLDRWGDYLSGPWRIGSVPGHHMSVIRDPHVAELASQLSADLEEAFG